MAQPRNINPYATPQELEEKRQRNEFMDLETTLSIHQLLTLLQIEVQGDAAGIYEPIWPLTAKNPPPSILAAPGLSESALLRMAQARSLERLGLVVLDLEGRYWNLTMKGRAAVGWWRECLEAYVLDTQTESSTT